MFDYIYCRGRGDLSYFLKVMVTRGVTLNSLHLSRYLGSLSTFRDYKNFYTTVICRRV